MSRALVLGVLLLVPGCPPWSTRDLYPGHAEQCVERLATLGRLLAARQAAGCLDLVEGSAFLLQCGEEMTGPEQVCFRCPDDWLFDDVWEEGPDGKLRCVGRLRGGCSCRGPDRELLRRLAGGDTAGDDRFIIACDRCGEAGTIPHHKKGLCVLWSDGRAEITPWAGIAGYRRIEGLEDFGTIAGPGAADPRLRHLIQ